MDSAVTTQNDTKNSFAADNSAMKITIDKAIADKYGDNRSFNIVYTLDSRDTTNAGFSMTGIPTPSFGDGTYNQKDNTITVTGSNLDQILNFNKDNLKFEGEASNIVSYKVTDSQHMVVTLKDGLIKKFKTDKPYHVTYVDDQLGTLDSLVNVAKTTLESSANYADDGTITVKGTNLGFSATADDVTFSDGVKPNSVSVTDDTLTIKRTPIKKTFHAQEFTLDYKLSGGETYAGIKFTVDGDKALAPEFDLAAYELHSKTITVTGKNLDQIDKFDPTKFSLDNGATAKVTAATVKGTTLTLTLDNEIAEKADPADYKITYKDDFETSASGIHVKGISKLTSTEATINGAQITFDGANLLDDNTAATIDGLPSGITVTGTTTKDNHVVVALNKAIDPVYFQAYPLTIHYTNDGQKLDIKANVQANGKTPTFTAASYDDKTTITIEGTNLDQISNWTLGSFKGIPNGITVTKVETSASSLKLTISKAIELGATPQDITISYEDGHGNTFTATNAIHIEAKATLGTATLTDANTITVAGTNLTNKRIDASKVTVANETVTSGTATATALTIKVKEPIIKEYWAEQSFAISLDGGLSGTLTSTLTVGKDDKVPAFTSATISNNITTITITGTNISQLGTIDKAKLSLDKGTLDIKDVSSTDTTITINLNTALAAGTFTIKYDDGHNTDLSTSLTLKALYELKNAHYDEDKTITVEIANSENLSDTTIFNSGWTIAAPDKQSYSVTSSSFDNGKVTLKLDKKIDTVKVSDPNNNGNASLLNSKITINFTDPSTKQVKSVVDNLPEKDWKSSLTKNSVCKYEVYDGTKAKITLKGTNLANVDWSVKDNWQFNGNMGGTDADPMNANDFENSSDIIGIKIIDANTVEIDINDHSGSFSTTLQTFGIQYTAKDGTKYRTVYANPVYQDAANGFVA